MSERNGKIYCDECNLDVMRQPHRAVPREANPPQPASIKHYHNRETGDCWSKHLAKAQALPEAQMMLFAHDAGCFPVKGVIQ